MIAACTGPAVMSLWTESRSTSTRASDLESPPPGGGLAALGSPLGRRAVGPETAGTAAIGSLLRLGAVLLAISTPWNSIEHGTRRLHPGTDNLSELTSLSKCGPSSKKRLLRWERHDRTFES